MLSKESSLTSRRRRGIVKNISRCIETHVHNKKVNTNLVILVCNNLPFLNIKNIIIVTADMWIRYLYKRNYLYLLLLCNIKIHLLLFSGGLLSVTCFSIKLLIGFVTYGITVSTIIKIPIIPYTILRTWCIICLGVRINYYEIGMFTFSMLYYLGEQREVEMGKMGIRIVYYTHQTGFKTNL